jgi:hypothetical protein
MTKKIGITAISLHFQRNGVSGLDFYQFMYIDNPDGEKERRTFLATFRTKDKDETTIDSKTCRVTCLDNPSLSWRGDNIADDIQKYFDDTFGKIDGCLYNLIKEVNVQL